MGVEVTQLVRGDRILRGFDFELSSALTEAMKNKGVNLIVCNLPICISPTFVTFEFSILLVGKCHNKSKIVFIFFLLNNWLVFFPIPLIF